MKVRLDRAKQRLPITGVEYDEPEEKYPVPSASPVMIEDVQEEPREREAYNGNDIEQTVKANARGRLADIFKKKIDMAAREERRAKRMRQSGVPMRFYADQPPDEQQALDFDMHGEAKKKMDRAIKSRFNFQRVARRTVAMTELENELRDAVLNAATVSEKIYAISRLISLLHRDRDSIQIDANDLTDLDPAIQAEAMERKSRRDTIINEINDLHKLEVDLPKQALRKLQIDQDLASDRQLDIERIKSGRFLPYAEMDPNITVEQTFERHIRSNEEIVALAAEIEILSRLDVSSMSQHEQDAHNARLEAARERQEVLRRHLFQRGYGRRLNIRDDGQGLDTSQINTLMRGYRDYLGCIGRDQIPTLRIMPGKRFGFVMNTDPSTKAGIHWVAIYVDNRPNGSNSFEYYNSLADQPNRYILHSLRQVIAMIRPQQRMTFKVNKIADQEGTSENCGYFATKFLIDRFNGVPFAEASGYNRQAPAGEANIERWKQSLGIKPFGHLGYSEEEDGQTGEGIRDVLRSGAQFAGRVYNNVKEAIRGPRLHASPNVRKSIEKYGDMQIVDMKVCRKPIFGVIDRVANVLSNGQWEQNKMSLSYDKLFHLFLLVKLADGTTLKIEKNHVVEIQPTSWESGNKTEELGLRFSSDLNLGMLIANGEKNAGPEKFWVYDARTQNCQFFMKWLLQPAGAWTGSVDKFVMQDAEKVLSGLGYLGDAARVVTDIAGRADIAMNGRGHRRCFGGRR